MTMPPNNALVSDACAAALRASFSAAQRGRSVARGSTAGPHKGMTACDHRLTFAALNLADAKRPIARHEQPSYRQTQLRNEYGPSPRELRR